jgi:hypothetical protein
MSGGYFIKTYKLNAKYKDYPFLYQVTVLSGTLTESQLKSKAFLKIKEIVVDYNSPRAKKVKDVIEVNYVIYRCNVDKCTWKAKIMYVAVVTEADEHDLLLNPLETRFVIFVGMKGDHSVSEHKKEAL